MILSRPPKGHRQESHGFAVWRKLLSETGYHTDYTGADESESFKVIDKLGFCKSCLQLFLIIIS